MAMVGTVIVWILMACMVIGGAASMIKPESELGQQFVDGICSVGPIFISVAGIFASIPYLTKFVEFVFGPAFAVFGADPSLASTTLIAVDMGGYQVADALAATRESWIMAMFTGFMAGATIVYTMPIGLRMIEKKDQKYFALGTMCGFLAIPIGVFVASAICAVTDPMIREVISTNAAATYQLALTFGLIFRNLIPLTIICVLIALGLYFIPNGMIKGFMVFGKFVDYASRVVLICAILEYFTGLFSTIFGGWGFDPIVASDPDNLERAIEICCYVCMMLSGAFTLVYMIKTYLAKPLGKIGKVFGLSDMATAGILATAANALAMFPMLKDMKGVDKCKVVAFAVCGSFIIGDHLSFSANFQPNLIAPLFIGKLVAAVMSVVFVRWLAAKKAQSLEEEDLAAEAAEAAAAEAEAAKAGAKKEAEATA